MYDNQFIMIPKRANLETSFNRYILWF